MSHLSVEPQSTEGLPEVDDSRDLMRYLLDPTGDAGMRIDELRSAFADLALHQLGMVAGAIDGAKEMLVRLSPYSLGASPAGQLPRTSLGVMDFLWPWAAAGHYYRFAEKHMGLLTRDAFTAHLYGSKFARAYERIARRRR